MATILIIMSSNSSTQYRVEHFNSEEAAEQYLDTTPRQVGVTRIFFPAYMSEEEAIAEYLD